MDILNLSREVVERYRQYLLTTFSFRDPVLRASFEEALRRGSLSRGPYIEATPPFRRGRMPRELFTELLEGPFDEGFLKALYGDRPLYLHQEKAIRRVIGGRNVVVATGTGSGKTETFLYPILLHLYREHLQGELGPGVRALILYPMNALAHDQRERLGAICKRLEEFGSPFRFTFGQYVGETPEDEKDTYRQAQEHLERRMVGELVLRREMREGPPHILLTNYSMLEYLLLRPEDSPLFDHGRARWWTFLVLDEAHQYRGTRGTEMALLIRRLKRRLREGGREGPFRCIATSATLLGGERDREAVSRFASELFGEPFHEDDVVLSEPEPLREPEPSSAVFFQPEEYATFEEALEKEKDDAIRVRVGRELLRDKRTARLSQELSKGPQEVEILARRLFPELPPKEQEAALGRLLRLLVRARNPETDTPLLSVRYHLFLRALEGVFVRYLPEKRVLLERAEGQGSEEGTVFEVALCRECGQHYLVGRERDGRWVEAVRDPSRKDFDVRYLRPLEDEDEEAEVEEEEELEVSPTKKNKGKQDLRLLCIRCGALGGPHLTPPPCNHSEADLLKVVEPSHDDDSHDDEAQADHRSDMKTKRTRAASHDDEARADQLKRCSACGYTASGRDPVSELVYGGEGPHAVIATTLHRQLPPKRRRVLAFADGRQNAAFFAWYLEGSYKDILARSLLLEAARRLAPVAGAEGLSLSDLATELRSLLKRYRVLPAGASELDLRREAWRLVYREFLTNEVRISLEGVGLVRWTVKLPDWIEIPVALTRPPWNLAEEEARTILLHLLDTMRLEKAVELKTEEGVTLDWSDLGTTIAPSRVRLGPPRGDRAVRDWAGPHGRRARFLSHLLQERGLPEDKATAKAIDTLREIWGALNEMDERAPSTAERLLLPIKNARCINPRWWRLMPLSPGDFVYRCQTCGRLTPWNLGLCPQYRCRGRLYPIAVQDLPSDHYRELYQQDFPGPLRVEEHTAQLSYEKAREYQQAFKAGEIHVLSCSTTFELGVDLGELDVVFLRNVPPEPFNYAQRVGRAGRREEPGFALTYCRRSSHDLYHFAHPERILQGHIRPPTLSLHNEKLLRRHLMAVVLSSFFRAHPERFRSVEALVGDWQEPTLLSALQEFLKSHRKELEAALHAILPPDSDTHEALGLHDSSWIRQVVDPEGRLALAVVEVVADYRTVKELECKAAERRDYLTARWAQSRANTIADEDVLSFLSRKAVIPKYGFPVDVVELDTHKLKDTDGREQTEVAFQRDLQIAISEFAPSAEVIANKKLWRSHGLKRVPERAWPLYEYRLCPRHNTFVQWERGAEAKELPCGCHAPKRSYVKPQFGFVTKRGKPKEPQGRPQRLFSTRPYFAGGVGRSPDSRPLPRLLSHSQQALLVLTPASPGRMVTLCEGRLGSGFYLCLTCGAGDRNLKEMKNHQTPYGQPCRGKVENVSLGHEFITDILRLEFQLAPSGKTAEFVQKDPVGFAYSLAYALVEAAAELLEIPSTDLNAVVAYEEGRLFPPILLYDDVPGGAGLVARLEDETLLRACLELARERVSGSCGCGEQSSCYGCLRSYRNQFMHDRLRRGPVRTYLEELLRLWPEAAYLPSQ